MFGDPHRQRRRSRIHMDIDIVALCSLLDPRILAELVDWAMRLDAYVSRIDLYVSAVSENSCTIEFFWYRRRLAKFLILQEALYFPPLPMPVLTFTFRTALYRWRMVLRNIFAIAIARMVDHYARMREVEQFGSFNYLLPVAARKLREQLQFSQKECAAAVSVAI